ncbi:hypothetical protein EB077_12280 [bacterium]|nr:hypothetical protein [bacterium]NDG25825.1 hypothetical protein [Pseudomonadota bacterium]
MSGSRARLVSAQIFNAASMTGTGVNLSSEVDVSQAEIAAIELVWTGTPTGTFQIQAAVQVLGGGAAGGTGAGVTWQNIISPAPTASGAAGQHLINLSDFGFSKLRVEYTNASGTGTLNGYITVKGQ